MKRAEEQLADVLETMDVPKERKEPTMPNLLWMLRNLGIRNGEHRDFPEAIRLINSLLRVYEYRGDL